MASVHGEYPTLTHACEINQCGDTEWPREAREEIWGSSRLWRFLLVLINRPLETRCCLQANSGHVFSIISLHAGRLVLFKAVTSAASTLGASGLLEMM